MYHKIYTEKIKKSQNRKVNNVVKIIFVFPLIPDKKIHHSIESNQIYSAKNIKFNHKLITAVGFGKAGGLCLLFRTIIIFAAIAVDDNPIVIAAS